jgi:hypothetical protein
MRIKMELVDFANRRITYGQLSGRLRRILRGRGLERSLQILNEEAIGMRNTIITSMRNSPATGKRYYRRSTRGGKRVYHRASSPYKPPRVDSGDLVRSIDVDARIGEIEVGSRIGGHFQAKHGKRLNWSYPAFLESGTKHMKPRPWLGPAYNKHEPRLKRRLIQSLRNIAGRMAGP